MKLSDIGNLSKDDILEALGLESRVGVQVVGPAVDPVAELPEMPGVLELAPDRGVVDVLEATASDHAGAPDVPGAAMSFESFGLLPVRVADSKGVVDSSGRVPAQIRVERSPLAGRSDSELAADSG